MPHINYLAFLGNPLGFLTWLETNLLRAGFLANTLTPGIATIVNITPRMPGYPGEEMPEVVNRFGTTASDWDIRLDPNPGNLIGLPAYICNYSQYDTHSLYLGDEADFCFTPNLTGCTIAVQHDQHETRMWHSNWGGRSSDQRAELSTRVPGGLGSHGVSLLEPAMYRSVTPGDDTRDDATVFGLRVNGGWRFYFQHYTRNTWTGAVRINAIVRID